MGATTEVNMGSDPAQDFNDILSAYSVGGGIYYFSGTQANHVYHEQGVSVSKAEIAEWVRMWWDGKSDNWTSDKEFADARKDASNPFQLQLVGKTTVSCAVQHSATEISSTLSSVAPRTRIRRPDVCSHTPTTPSPSPFTTRTLASVMVLCRCKFRS